MQSETTPSLASLVDAFEAAVIALHECRNPFGPQEHRAHDLARDQYNDARRCVLAANAADGSSGGRGHGFAERKVTYERIYEPDEKMTHYAPPPGLDQVTLCGMTDWLNHREHGRPTRRAVSCHMCETIAGYFGYPDRPDVALAAAGDAA